MTTFGKGLELATTAGNILTAVVAHFDAAGVELPERRYVAAGHPREIAWDCEQLTVALEGIGWGQARDESAPNPRVGSPASVYAVRHAIVAVQLVRCTPKANGRDPLPTPEAIHAAGLAYMRDAGLLSQALVTIAAELRAGLTRESSVELGAIESIGPDGGYHGMETVMAITTGQLT